jgi:hypothetical protein
LPIAWWPVVATFVVYYKMLFDYVLLFDDFIHLYNVSNLPFLDAIRIPMGGHLLYSFTTVVWLVKRVFGVAPSVFLLLALLLHLASVRLLFEIIFRLTARQNLAAFGACLWGMSPYAAASLDWISVHGHVYATAAILWVLFDIVRHSQKKTALANVVLLRHVVLLLVAATSFGMGLASAVIFAPAIALWNPLPEQRYRLLVAYGLAALAVAALYFYTMIMQGEGPDNLAQKTGLLRHGLDNFPAILRALAELLSIGSSGLLLGPLAAGKFSLVTAANLPVFAAAFAVGVALPLLIAGCMLSNPKERRQIFALLLLPCAAYGLVAIARTGLILPYQMSAPRLHYLVPAVFAIVLCLVLARIIDRLPKRVLRYGRIALMSWLGLMILPYTMGPVEAVPENVIEGQNKQYKEAMLAIKTAIETSTERDKAVIVNKSFQVFPWAFTPKIFPGIAAVFVMNYPSNVVDGKHVYFLEKSEKIVQKGKALTGSRISELLVYEPNLAR